MSEHLLTLEELSLKLETRICPEKPAASLGITDDEAAERLQRFGPNMLSPPAKKHAILIYLDHLLGLFNVMLLVSGVACYVIYILDPVSSASNVYIGAILLFVAFANAYVTFYQVQKSQSVLESFMV